MNLQNGSSPLSNGVRTGLSLAGRLKSVGYAVAGIGFLLRTQPNARLHMTATVLILGAAWRVRMNIADLRWLVAAITSVWCAEAVNTAVEYVCDAASPGFSFPVKRAKDIAAGAVLITAIGAAVIGVMTFSPYLPRR